MRDIVRLIVWAVVDLFRSRAAIEAEILTLRQQIIVLRRAAPKKPSFGAIAPQICPDLIFDRHRHSIDRNQMSNRVLPLRCERGRCFTAAIDLCVSKIKSEHIRGASRRGLGGKEYALPSSRCAIGARPYPRPSACASHYSSERKISEFGADVPRLRQ
jgi:hypothetical protein